ncbi:MAG TPA: hypothetical protein PLA71_00070 [Saccharofermentans sp.]|nr:hypothetical protein [Saccharofermentans sp.]
MDILMFIFGLVSCVIIPSMVLGVIILDRIKPSDDSILKAKLAELEYLPAEQPHYSYISVSTPVRKKKIRTITRNKRIIRTRR